MGIDNKLKMVTNGVSKYFLQDHLGSTTALTNSSGSVIESATYDSFGNATGNLSTRYQFTGREFDADLGLQYSRARWYDATLGRFISEDPIGFAGGDVNLYGYVGNNPQNFVDPSGNQRADRDRPGDQYPGMREPYQPKSGAGSDKDLKKLACTADGYNPWLTLEGSGALQFGPLGGSTVIEANFNPLTNELCFYTKLMSGNGGAIGVFAGAGLEGGLALFGKSEGVKGVGTEIEAFFDGAAFGGGSGSLSYGGDTGLGIGIGPQIGGGAAAGFRIGEKTLLFCINQMDCSCYN